MKKDIHPQSFEVTAHCACGNEFKTSSTKDLIKTTLCSACHPFFTGKHKFVDTAGRIERFQSKYKNFEGLGLNKNKTKKN
ncbi:MAG TPA: 50S ribosomal protein L31 [Candidatus Babeliales bacterium]|nr:50S ribosomal protein L31 [Candidatus Babeliales bacterium]